MLHTTTAITTTSTDGGVVLYLLAFYKQNLIDFLTIFLIDLLFFFLPWDTP